MKPPEPGQALAIPDVAAEAAVVPADVVASAGRDVADLAEALYVRLFMIALAGMMLVCGMLMIAALVRTDGANLARTTLLTAVLATLAGAALRDPARWYLAIRRRPVLSLVPPMLGLIALVIDKVGHSPMSFAAAVSIAVPAFVCGRRWALAGATMIALGAVSAALLKTGPSALNSVGQGTIAYFVWALVLSGLAERFARLAMTLPGIENTPTHTRPIRVSNLASDPAVAESRPRQPPGQHDSSEPKSRRADLLTARQAQVIALLAAGFRASDIAIRLGIAPSTVYRYVERAKHRAGVSTLAELVAVAIEDGVPPAKTDSADRPDKHPSPVSP